MLINWLCQTQSSIIDPQGFHVKKGKIFNIFLPIHINNSFKQIKKPAILWKHTQNERTNNRHTDRQVKQKDSDFHNHIELKTVPHRCFLAMCYSKRHTNDASLEI